ncbi:DUF6634 family protein [Bradyrhizobium niftali]|uniref:DUF6634 family protein n=1 Tax=Bradyrhizobium niftali TaxID=2560055 RepID=UPI00384B3915
MGMTSRSTSVDPILRDLGKLTADLRRIRAGDGPSSKVLEGCPLLDQWSIGFLPAACLVGAVYRHPLLGSRPSLYTSEIVFIDPSRRWARTRSMYYRLGAERHDPLPGCA